MQTINIIVIIALLANTSLYSQQLPARYADLQGKIERINRDTTMKKITLNNDDFLQETTDGGGALTGYFKNGKIQKITRKIGISYGIETYDYYFEDEKLRFIYELFEGFLHNDSTGALNYEKTFINFVGRYYFRNNMLVDHETTGHNRFEGNRVYMERTLLEETKENLRLLKEAKQTEVSSKLKIRTLQSGVKKISQ